MKLKPLSTRDLSSRLGLSVSHVTRLARQGKIPEQISRKTTTVRTRHFGFRGNRKLSEWIKNYHLNKGHRKARALVPRGKPGRPRLNRLPGSATSPNAFTRAATPDIKEIRSSLKRWIAPSPDLSKRPLVQLREAERELRPIVEFYNHLVKALSPFSKSVKP